MKRIYLVLSAALIVQIAGCNGNNSKENTKETNAKNPTEEVLALNNNPVPPDVKHSTTKLTKAQFIEKVWNYEKSPQEFVFLGDKPCLIDFYAEWCAPCKMTAPIMEELAVEYKGKINIYKIDIDKEKELASVFGIQSIPTFVIVPQVKQPQMLSGLRNKDFFKQVIEEYMLK